MQKFKHLKIIITGGNGFLGSSIVNYLKNSHYNLVTPSKKQLNITSLKSITYFLKEKRPQVLINFASFTNIKEAEQQRNDKKGLAWKTNVAGARYLAKTCKKQDIFLIHISTDSVFPGTMGFPGPYDEQMTPPDKSEKLSWYGYTKLKGDQFILKTKPDSALIRISYPFGNLKSLKDFAVKTEKYINSGINLFSNQRITPTYIPDLYFALSKIIDFNLKGIFHVSCQKITTPYKFAFYIAKKTNLDIDKIQKTSMENYISKNKSPMRSKFGGLKTNFTEQRLGVNFHTWKKAIDELYD